MSRTSALFVPGPRLRWTLVAGAVLWVLLAWSSALRKSATVDEVPHLAAGLMMLDRHDLRMNPEHPPLFKLASALPVYLFARPNLDPGQSPWTEFAWARSLQAEYGQHLIFRAGQRPGVVLGWARIIPVLIGLAGGLLAGLYAWRVTRSRLAGILAASVLLLLPEYLGHARFVTMDVPTLACCGAVSYTAWRYLVNPGPRTLAWLTAAVVIGSQVKLPVTLFSLLTAAVLLPLAVHARGWRPALREWLTAVAVIAVCVIAAMWVLYGFRYSHVPPGEEPLVRTVYLPDLTREPRSLREQIAWAVARWQLLPEAALGTIVHSGSFAGRPMYFMGQFSRTGWYHYFFVTFVLKTPVLITLGMIAACVGLAARPFTHRRALPRQTRAYLILFVPFLLLFAFYCIMRPNIGHRHVLFLYFPLAVALGALLARMMHGTLAPRLAAAAVLVSLPLNIVLSAPHFETYFNEFIRTPARGAAYVTDSNVDWGGDIPIAAQLWRDLGAPQVNYAAFGLSPPEPYGLTRYRWILPNYPFAAGMPEAVNPDPSLPTIATLGTLPALSSMYPRLYDRPPDITVNSIAVFLPGPSALRPPVDP